MSLVTGGNASYDPAAQKRIMAEAKKKFEKSTTELAGKKGLKTRVNKALSRAGYNFTRYMTEQKEQPKAKALEAQLLNKQNQR
jgi:hypothetical protein